MVGKLYLGIHDLERHSQRLYDLRLETTLHDPVYRRVVDDCGVFFGLSTAYVLDLYRLNVRRLVVRKTRILRVIQ